MRRRPRIHAIVLAGGRGERLGGVSKADVRIGGRRLLDLVLDGIDPVVTGRRVVVGPPEVEVPAGVWRTFEDPPGGGPLAGIGAGLETLGQAGCWPWRAGGGGSEAGDDGDRESDGRESGGRQPGGRACVGCDGESGDHKGEVGDGSEAGERESGDREADWGDDGEAGSPEAGAWCLVCAVDTPGIARIGRGLAGLMDERAGQCDGVVAFGGRPQAFRQYLQAIYSVDALGRALVACDGLTGQGVTRALRGLRLAELPVPAELCRDLDTPADLAFWEGEGRSMLIDS